MTPGRPLDPRRVGRPLRIAILASLLAYFAWSFRDIRVVSIPDGPACVLEIPPGQAVFVKYYRPGMEPSLEDVAIFVGSSGGAAYGRIVAFASDSLDVDWNRFRLRRDGTKTWYPAPSHLFDQLPLSDGECLILADNDAAEGAGEVVPLTRLVARVVVAMPW